MNINQIKQNTILKKHRHPYKIKKTIKCFLNRVTFIILLLLTKWVESFHGRSLSA